MAFRDELDVPNIVHTGWRELMDLSKVPFAYKDLTEFKNRIIYYEIEQRLSVFLQLLSFF